jgi:hypothetical protein
MTWALAVASNPRTSGSIVIEDNEMRYWTKIFLILLLIASHTLAQAASQSTDLGQNRNAVKCVKRAIVDTNRRNWTTAPLAQTATYYGDQVHSPARCPSPLVPVAIYRSGLSRASNTYNWTTDSIKRSDTDYVYFFYRAGTLGYANGYANYALYCAPIIYNWVCTP